MLIVTHRASGFTLFRNNDHNSVFTTSNGDYDTMGLDAYRHWRHPVSFPATC